MKKSKVEALLYAMLMLAVVISLVNLFIIQSRAAKIVESKEIAEEFLRPAEIEVKKILVPNCEACFDIGAVLESIKKQNVNVTKETTYVLSESEAKELIEKFGIKQLPTLIISGETNKTPHLKSFFDSLGEFSDENIVVFTGIKAPYYDVSSAKVAGEVSVTNLIDSSCKECVPLTQAVLALQQAGVAITEQKTFEYNSKEGQELIRKFSITAIPAMLISNEINNYGIVEQIQQLAEEKNGFYALHATSAPYRDLKEGKIVGLTKLVLLTDKSCKECFDVDINKQILLRLGVFVRENVTYDISSTKGKSIILKYDIEKVPMIILSPEASSYPIFVQAWQSVGSIEEDEWYVMRKPENLGAYKDLKTNEVVKANEVAQQN